MTYFLSFVVSRFTLHSWLSLAESLILLNVIYAGARFFLKRSKILSTIKESNSLATVVRLETRELRSAAAKLLSKFSITHMWTEAEEAANLEEQKKLQRQRWKNRGGAVINALTVFVVAMWIPVLYAVWQGHPVTSYECPENCLGIVKVEGPKAIETINLATGQHREWRFDIPVTLFPGYVVELFVSERPNYEALAPPTNYYHIVRGKDLAQRPYTYRLAKAATTPDGDDRPVLARECHNTWDDSGVVCEGLPFSQIALKEISSAKSSR